MEDAVWRFLEEVSDTPGPLTYALIVLSALIEYVFPPFPGDTVTLFAGFLVGAKEWSLPGVFIAVNGGSLAGALIDYAAGVWLAAPGRKWKTWGPRWRRLAVAIDRISAGFARHGVLYLSINRFLPSLRALFFVAAGAARLPLWKVATFGLLSSVLWNVLILLAGWWLGYNKEALIAFMASYSALAWAVIGVAVVVASVVWWVRRRSGRSSLTPGA